MEKSELRFSNYPTPEELYAVERAARAARADEMARIIRGAFSTVRNWLSGAGDKGLRHA